MTDLPISENTARRLRAIAESQRRSLDELLDEFASQYPEAETEPNAMKSAPGTLARLGEAADRMTFQAQEQDIGRRSRELLHGEFADYLLKRMHKQDTSTDE
jgi:hypothetical protein